MPLGYYPGMDNRDHTNRFHTISPSVPPAPTEKVGCMTPPVPTRQEAGTTPPAPTRKETGKIPPTPVEIEASTILPTEKEAGTTPEKPIDPKQKGTPKPDWPATPSSSDDDDDNSEDEEHVCCFLLWLGLDLDCKRMLNDETKILGSHERKVGNEAVPVFQQAVSEDPELCIEAWAQSTAAVYVMREEIVQLNTRLGNILYFACGQGKWNADTDGGKRKRVRKE